MQYRPKAPTTIKFYERIMALSPEERKKWEENNLAKRRAYWAENKDRLNEKRRQRYAERGKRVIDIVEQETGHKPRLGQQTQEFWARFLDTGRFDCETGGEF